MAPLRSSCWPTRRSRPAVQARRPKVWDIETGQRRAAYPFERGFGPVPVVEDAEQGIASVVIGVAIHPIRLADGRDVVLDIENQAGPAHAELAEEV